MAKRLRSRDTLGLDCNVELSEAETDKETRKPQGGGGHKKRKEKSKEQKEDFRQNRIPDHHHTPGAPSLSLRGLTTMHGIHPQVVP